MSMVEGEVATFEIKPYYAYGEEGNPTYQVPPGTSIVLTIELLETAPKPEPVTEVTDLMEYATDLKEKANKKFKKKKFEEAD